jgi:repressor LexA
MNLVKSLTPKQQQFLDRIKKYIAENNFSPTFREMSEMINIGGKAVALSTVQYYVDTLKSKGYIDKDSNNERGFMLSSTPNHTIPLLGIIAAGNPIEAIENPDIIDIPLSINLNPNYQYYALRVQGDSMIDMGILDGDIVVVKHQFSANNGDVVVAITEKGATLKIYDNNNGKVRLLPRNDKYAPIIPQQIEVRGIFQGLIRP